MLTVEVKQNGRIVAEARIVPCGGIVSDGTQVTDDYDVQWVEEQGDGLEAVRDAGSFVIKGHRRGMSTFCLATKVCAGILKQMVERREGKG